MSSSSSSARVAVLGLLAGLGGYAACGDSSSSDPQGDAGVATGSSGTASSSGNGSSGNGSSGNGSSGNGSSSSGELDGSAEVEGGVAITGKIVSDISAIAGVAVVVQGKSVQTAANGSFSLAGVSVPYDLSVVVPPNLGAGPAGSSKVVHFVGLTTPNPVLDVDARLIRPTANVKGTLLGGSNSPNVRYLVFGSGPGGRGGANTGTSSNPKVFDVDSSWPTGQSQQSLSLIALEYTPRVTADPDSNLPSQYNYAGSTSLSVQDGTAVVRDITLATLSQTHLTGTVTFPEGYSRNRRRALGLRGPQSGEIQFGEANSFGEFDYLVPFSPLFPTASLVFLARSDDNTESSFVKRIVRIDETFTTPPVNIVMPLAPTLVAPEQSAAGVTTSTVLSWNPVGADCLYAVRIDSVADGSTQFELRTTSTSVTVPDLGATGVGLTPATAYTWYVSCEQQEASPASIDAAARPNADEPIGTSTSRQRSFLSQ